MKNRYNNFRVLFTSFCMLLIATGGFPLSVFSQNDQPQVFVQVDCIKVLPENEGKYIEFIKSTAMPLQQERIKLGAIGLWYLYKVRFTGTGDSYNYIGITLYTDMAQIENPWKGLDVGKVLPGKDMNKVQMEASAMRNIVSSTLLARQDFVYPEGGPGDFKYLQVDYMKVAPGMESEYLDVETNVWKPVHNEFIKAGTRVGWSLWGRVFPSGAGLDFQYVTVNYYTDWLKIGTDDYNGAFAKAHPGKNTDELAKRTGDSRVLAKSELWEVVEKVIPQ